MGGRPRLYHRVLTAIVTGIGPNPGPLYFPIVTWWLAEEDCVGRVQSNRILAVANMSTRQHDQYVNTFNTFNTIKPLAVANASTSIRSIRQYVQYDQGIGRCQYVPSTRSTFQRTQRHSLSPLDKVGLKNSRVFQVLPLPSEVASRMTTTVSCSCISEKIR